MLELITKKKKKKKTTLGLNSSEESSNERDIVDNLTQRVKEAFKGHVGEENSITPRDLFQKVFSVEPEDVEFYKRIYFWEVVKKILHNLRLSKELFVINKVRYLFVLKTQTESNEFRARMDKIIESLQKTQDNADNWVNSKKWREFQ